MRERFQSGLGIQEGEAGEVRYSYEVLFVVIRRAAPDSNIGQEDLRTSSNTHWISSPLAQSSLSTSAPASVIPTMVFPCHGREK